MKNRKPKEIRSGFINTSEASRELLRYSSGSCRGALFKTPYSQLLNYFYKLCHIVIYTAESHKEMKLALILTDPKRGECSAKKSIGSKIRRNSLNRQKDRKSVV